MKRMAFALSMITALIGAESAEAQGRGAAAGVPPGHRPPPGMCRVWIDGVPPGRQPEPTDCATARADRTPNSRVIHGDAVSRDRRDRDVWYDRDRLERRDRDHDRDDDGWEDDDGWGDDDDGRTTSRRGSEICYDRDRDGWCDDARRRDVCADRDRDGRCDGVRSPASTSRSGRSWPEMIAAVLANRGRRSADQVRWFGTADVEARYRDANRDRVPDWAAWYDRSGRLVQVWHDRNRDGRADRIELYRRGELYRVIR